MLDQFPSTASSFQLDMWALLFSTNTHSLTLSQPINILNSNLKYAVWYATIKKEKAQMDAPNVNFIYNMAAF